jgi:lysophospholipid acyltransferase (LPLAT)-like uncharacterized protein
VVHFMGVLPYVKIEKPKAQWKKWKDGIIVLADKKAKNILFFFFFRSAKRMLWIKRKRQNLLV